MSQNNHTHLYQYKKLGAVSLKAIDGTHCLVASKRLQCFDVIGVYTGKLFPYDPLLNNESRTSCSSIVVPAHGGTYCLQSSWYHSMFPEDTTVRPKAEFKRSIQINCAQHCRTEQAGLVNSEFVVLPIQFLPEKVRSFARSTFQVHECYEGTEEELKVLCCLALIAMKTIPKEHEIIARRSLPIHHRSPVPRLIYEQSMYSFANFGHVDTGISRIMYAGHGVFATKDVSALDVLSFYAGEVLPYDPLDTTARHLDLDIGKIKGGKYIVRGLRLNDLYMATSDTSFNIAQMCNDAQRSEHINAEYISFRPHDVPSSLLQKLVLYSKDNKRDITPCSIMCLVAIRNIPAKGEIYVNYSHHFWQPT